MPDLDETAAFRRCRGYRGESYLQEPHIVPDDASSFGPGKSQCRICYRAYAADWRAARAGRPNSQSAVGQASAVLDGVAQLAALLARAGYPSVLSAVAEHTVFLAPETVAQTGGDALFPTIRDFVRRGKPDMLEGRRVMLDDNTSPTHAFLWAASLAKGRDVQFNHVWNYSRDPTAYTALWNVCATPAFLAKTTDGSNHPEVVSALRYHAYRLYGHRPTGTPEPTEPDGYAQLSWATHPRPVADLEAQLRARLVRNAKSRTAIAAREIGWLFSGWKPDQAL